MKRLVIVFVTCGASALMAAASCGRPSVTATATPKPSSAQAATPAAVAAPTPDPTRLPEDPVAGKAAEQQWREHMVAEERERQMMFDRPRLKQHRALAKLIAASRARYDRAKTPAAVDKVRTEMQRSVEEIRKRVTEIDHWGVNSRLLGDYDALAVALGSGYAEAKLAALRGDAHALAEAKAAFDQHQHTISAWLEAVEKGEDE